MALIKTSNPALGKNTFNDFAQSQYGGNLVDASARMTLSGTVNKTGILLLCAVATAAWTWNSFMQTRDMSTVGPAIMIGAFGGLIVAFVTIFKKAVVAGDGADLRAARGPCAGRDCQRFSTCAIQASPWRL